MTTDLEVSESKITRIEATRLDQLVQVLEISFIFLLSYSLVTLIDSAFVGLEFYNPIADEFLGERGFGNLNGGNFEEILRITILFNLLLFTFSLLFGLWMRRTRDGWTWKQLGYTWKTEKYSTQSLIKRSILLGIIGIVALYSIMIPILLWENEFNLESVYLFHTFAQDGSIFTLKQLNAEFYFGIIEMGFIWPLSAGFFFFSYCHNSLKARFPIGVANLLSTLFYVFYLAFFFMISTPGKLLQLPSLFSSPFAWGHLLAFFVLLYISFSAFSETESILLPFLLNFVFNVGLTVFRSVNAFLFTSATPLMLLPYVFMIIAIVIWRFLSKDDFSTIRLGINHFKDVFKKDREYSLLAILGIMIVFLVLSFIIPGVLELSLNDYLDALPPGLPELPIVITKVIIAFIYALMYISMIGLAIIVLTYEHTKVYDVLLVKSPEGLPLASHIELFQTDEVLISGFFTAISSVSKELGDTEKSDLRSIKRGDREILIEDGVLTRTIALVDRDQSTLRRLMQELQREFEKEHAEKLTSWIGDTNAIPEGKDYVKEISKLSIRFDIPQQTKWISVLTLVLTPLMIALIGLI